MFESIKTKIRFNQYNKALGEPLNPISALSILTVSHVDPKMPMYESDLTNSTFITSIDTIAFLAFLSNIMVSQASVGREKERWFAKYYLDYLSKLGAYIFSVPATDIASYALNRLTYLEECFLSSRNLETLVSEYANLLNRDSFRKDFAPIEYGTQLSFNAIEHVQYHIAATSLSSFYASTIKPSIQEVIKFLQTI